MAATVVTPRGLSGRLPCNQGYDRRHVRISCTPPVTMATDPDRHKVKVTLPSNTSTPPVTMATDPERHKLKVTLPSNPCTPPSTMATYPVTRTTEAITRTTDPKPQAEGKSSTSKAKGLIELHISTRAEETVHVEVGQCKYLKSKWTEHCNAYVQLLLCPDDSRFSLQESTMKPATNNPIFQQSFSFALTEQTKKKRLMLIVWSRDMKKKCSEFLGCLSFGLKHLAAKEKPVGGWYYLLSEDLGHRKHILAPHAPLQRPRDTATPLKTRQLTETTDLKQRFLDQAGSHVLKRGGPGYGFTVRGSCPVRIGHVKVTGSAYQAGIQRGDYVIRLNGMNMLNETPDHVANVIRQSLKQIVIDICKPDVMTDKYQGIKRTRLERSEASSSLYSSLNSENLDDAMMELPEFDLEDEVKENILSPLTLQKPVPKYSKWDPDMSAIPCIPSDGVQARLLESFVEEPVNLSVCGRGLSLCGRGFCEDDFLVEARAAFTSTDSSTSSQSTDSFTSSQSTDSSMSSHNRDSSMRSASSSSVNSMMSTDTTHSGHQSSLDLSRISRDLIRASRDVTRASPNFSETAHGLSRASHDLSRPSSNISLHLTAVQQLLQCEAEFVDEMHKAIQTYSRPLRYCVLSAKDHNKLFQNVEKLVAIAEFCVHQLLDTTSTSDPTRPLNSDDPVSGGVGWVYKTKVRMLCDSYTVYNAGLHEARTLLSQLNGYTEFSSYMNKLSNPELKMDITQFLNRPMKHLTSLVNGLRAVLNVTPTSNQEYRDLVHVLREVEGCERQCVNPVVQSNRPLDGGRNILDISVIQATPVSSMAAGRLEISCSPTYDNATKSSKSFQSLTKGRHLVFSGDLICPSTGCDPCKVFLYGDMLVVAMETSGGRITPACPPIYLGDIEQLVFSCSHPSEFCIHAAGKKMVFQALSIEEKSTWKVLLQQRIQLCTKL